MFWFLWALAASLCAAALAESNKVFKLDATMLNAWRSTFATALLCTAIPFMIWPHDKWFYVVACLDGAVTAAGMVMFFYLAARQSGRVSSMILPLAAIGAYVAWWMLMPGERPSMTAHPEKVAISVISAALIFVAIHKVRDTDISLNSFLIVLPVGFLFGVFDALTKYVMGQDFNLYKLALSYAFLELIVCSIVTWLVLIPQPLEGRPTTFFNKKLLWGSAWCALWTAGMVLSSIFAIVLAPHPTLPGLILALTPVWLYTYNKIRHIKDDVSIPASILLIVGAVGLLLSTL